jgi:hypothetical protein
MQELQQLAARVSADPYIQGTGCGQTDRPTPLVLTPRRGETELRVPPVANHGYRLVLDLYR